MREVVGVKVRILRWLFLNAQGFSFERPDLCFEC